jgi:hypothetical protein
MISDQRGQPFSGTVHVGRREDLQEFGRLYRAAYPHCTEKSLRHDIKPHEANSWIAYRDERGEVLIAMHIRIDGLVWLLADPAKADSLELIHGFLVLLQEAWATLALHGLRGIEVLYAPTLELLARRLEEQGLIDKQTAIIRTSRFDERVLNPMKAN